MRFLLGVVALVVSLTAHVWADAGCDAEQPYGLLECILSEELPVMRKAQLANRLVASVNGEARDEAKEALREAIFRVRHPRVRAILLRGVTDAGVLTSQQLSLLPRPEDAGKQIRPILRQHFQRAACGGNVECSVELTRRTLLSDCRATEAQPSDGLAIECTSRWCKPGCLEQVVQARFLVKPDRSWELERAEASVNDHGACGHCRP